MAVGKVIGRVNSWRPAKMIRTQGNFGVVFTGLCLSLPYCRRLGDN